MNQKLDPEFKSKWIAALRSGEYEQGTGRMYSNGELCCLAVAGVVCGIDPLDFVDTTIVWADPINNFEKYNKVLALARAKGYPEMLIVKGYDDEQVPKVLASMNDSGSTFFEIANYIEANL